MDTQQRADLLAVIAALCQCYPDWRFGQLVANVAGWADQEVCDVEDEQLLEAARLHLEQLTPPTHGLQAEPTAEADRGRHPGSPSFNVLAELRGMPRSWQSKRIGSQRRKIAASQLPSPERRR